MFPLTTSGYAGSFQDVMHMITTAAVVLLSIVSLVLIIIAGFKQKNISPMRFARLLRCV